MKIEQYEKANKIINKIKDYNEFLEVFVPGNSISLFASRIAPFIGCGQKCKSINVYSEPELAKIIRSYIENQVKELEKQLEEL